MPTTILRINMTKEVETIVRLFTFFFSCIATHGMNRHKMTTKGSSCTFIANKLVILIFIA